MNILWVSSPLTDTRGGALTVTKNLINGLKSHNHTYLGSCKYMGEMFQANGCDFVQSKAGFEPVTIKNWMLIPISFLMGIWQIVTHLQLLKNADKIILATCHTEVFFTIPWLIVLFRKPIIIMNHTGRCPRSIYKNPLLWIMKWSYNHSKVVFVSNAHKYMWLKHDLVGKNPTVLYNGVDIKDFRPRNIVPSHTIVFGYLGRIEEEKGIDVLFDALELYDSEIKTVVNIGGEGKDEKKYKERTEKIILQKPNISINWLSHVEDKDNFFESIDCLIFPSKFESFGLVMVETWERGIPVISSNIPALLELKSIIADRDANLVFKSGEPKELARCMSCFTSDLEEYRQIDYQNMLHNAVAKNFSTEQQVDKFSEIIKK